SATPAPDPAGGGRFALELADRRRGREVRRVILRRAAGVVLIAMVSVPGMRPAAAATLGELGFAPCVLTSVGLPRPTEAQCTTVTVPEDPAAPDGRTIELALAWVPVEGDAAPDPVFFIAGGPGQSARAQYPRLPAAFGDINRPRHILLLDQRGTGGSRPLYCPEQEGAEALLGIEEPSPQQLRELAGRCRDELQEVADLRFYTTTEAVHDLEFVRRRIGASRLNLIGVSYGTRVAQQYAKAHPQHVRTIILDSVGPADLALGAEHA